jgi:hypothetical protein
MGIRNRCRIDAWIASAFVDVMHVMMMMLMVWGDEQ